MKTKYTNGKWVIHTNTNNKKLNEPLRLHIYSDKRYICDVKSEDVDNDLEHQANAILIASSPELLQALILVQKSFKQFQNFPSVCRIVDEAIKKATEL